MSADERLTEIEIKVSHQDLLLEQLSDVLFQQQKTIDELEKKLTKLEKKLTEEPLEMGPAGQKPPHY